VSLADREPKITRKGKTPKIEEILDALPDEDREVLRRWLTDPRFVANRIGDELRAEGYDISDSAIAVYRYNKLGVGTRKR
jgi:hypothetical protein